MKTLLLFALLVLCLKQGFTQSPNAFNYQAVLRDVSGNLKINTDVNVQIDIIQGKLNYLIYSESFAVKTNEYGLINLQIGKGSVISGDFSTISWANGPFFIKIIVDNIELGTSQLLSVPFSLYAERAGNSFNGNFNNLTDKPTTLDGYGITDAATKASIEELKNLLRAKGALPLIDIDGNYYKTIKIGNQIWMAENLKTTKFNDGTPIPLIIDDTQWKNLTTPAYCWYMNDSITYKNRYGALYNGYIAETNKLCPLGWHIPGGSDWYNLMMYLGDYKVEGGKLKEIGFLHWDSPNSEASNESGFNALPAGMRNTNGSFAYSGQYTYYLTPSGSASKEYKILSYNNSLLKDSYDDNTVGYSVRCVKD